MNDLIHISSAAIGGASVQSVNARDLHAFLEVGKDFSTWVKDRIEQYGFQEGHDFEVFDSPILGNQTGRGGDRRSKDYVLSMDMAKELAMVERTEKGKQARQYFIECERAAHSLQRLAIAGTPGVQAASHDAMAVHGFLKTIGLDQNAAAISANQVAINLHGVNLLQLSGNTHLLAANQECQALTPTALGKLAGGLSAQKVNKALEEAGLQKRVGDEWVPLPAAEGLYRLFDTGKKHGSGVPVTQLKWFPAAVDRLKRAA